MLTDSNKNPKSIEIFLLVAVGKLGLSTLYALKQAGLEPGSVRGLIARLEQHGLLARAEERERHGARPMEVTGNGHRYVAEHWHATLIPKQEMESVLRSAAVAMAMADAEFASKFLLKAASERERYQGPTEANAETMRKGALDFHGEVREIYTHRRRAFEAGLLRELGSKLKETKSSAPGEEGGGSAFSNAR